MPVTDNAGWLSQDQTAKWLAEGISHNMQPAPVWAFKPIRGGALEVPIQAEIPISPESPNVVTADIVTNADALTDRTASPDADLSQVYPLGELGTRFTVPYFQRDTLTVPNDLTKLQIGQATLRLMYAYFKKICTWAGTPMSPAPFADAPLRAAGQSRTPRPNGGTFLPCEPGPLGNHTTLRKEGHA